MTSQFIARSASSLRHLTVAAGFAVLSLSTPAFAADTDVTGIWYDTVKEGAIEVAPCGKKFCGRIVWTKQKESSRGGPLLDIYNPVESQRKRPICGLVILRDLQPLTDGTFGRGVVYDPKKGQENEASLKRLGPDSVQLTGYGLFGLSKSFVWTRAPADIERCDGQPALNPAGSSIPAAGTPVAPPVKTKPIEASVAPPAPAKPAAAPAKPVQGTTAKPAAGAAAKPSTSLGTQKPAATPVKPQSAVPAAKTTASATTTAKKPTATAPVAKKTTTAATAPAAAKAGTAAKSVAKPAQNSAASKTATPAVKATAVTAKPAAKAVKAPAVTADAIANQKPSIPAAAQGVPAAAQGVVQ